MALYSLPTLLLLSLISGCLALQVRTSSMMTPILTLYWQCYQCDGVKGKDLPCEGNGKVGREVSDTLETQCPVSSLTQVECDGNCGLLLHQILHYDKFHSSVVSTDSRWRRGCTTDGTELTQDSEVEGNSLPGLGETLRPGPSTLLTSLISGCKQIADRSQDNQKHVSKSQDNIL